MTTEWERVSERARQAAKVAKRLGRDAFATAVLGVWARVQPARPHPWEPSISAGDNLQRPMNLIMPLRYRNVVERGKLTEALVKANEMIFVGLNNVGTVHFARFDLIGRNVCMFSIYDGELSGYIRDFIAVIGEAFDALMPLVRNGSPTPVSEHPDEFIAWVARHDAYQFPAAPTDLLPVLGSLERESLLVLRAERNVQFPIYRGYPGYSVAQIRTGLEIGW